MASGRVPKTVSTFMAAFHTLGKALQTESTISGAGHDWQPEPTIQWAVRLPG
jgi:hypothetical protein